MGTPILLRIAGEPGTNGVQSRAERAGYMDVEEGTIRDESGAIRYRSREGDWKTKQTDIMLANYAAEYWNQDVANKTGRDVRYLDSRGRERLVKCEFAPTDGHVPTNLPGYAAGYKLMEGIADECCPVVMIPKEEDKFFTWSSSAAFNRALPTIGAPGGTVNEVSASGGFTSFSTTRYALGAFVPTETTANQDAPIDVNQKMARRVLDALKLERELRVMTLATTSANFASGQVKTLAGGFQWNGGVSSNPLGDMQGIEHTSAMDVSFWVFSLPLYDYWALNANVQKFVAYKQSAQAVPDPGVTAVLRVKPIRVATMKFNGTSGLQFVWPSAASASAAVAFRVPAKMPPSDQMDIATMFTGRWAGGAPGAVPGATPVAGGFMLRRWFREERGALGGQMVVLTHADAEIFTSALVGGIVVNPIQ